MNPLKKLFIIFIIIILYPYKSFGQDEDYIHYDIDPSLIVYYDSVNPFGSNYNFNESVSQIGSKLKSIDIMDCYADLLSISNLESNYLFKKVKVPKVLLDFLIAQNIIQAPVNTKGLKREVFLLGRYIHSIEYDSYLLMVTEEYVDVEKDDIKELFLVNIKPDMLLSVCSVASYLSGIGLIMQTYSMYQGNDTFEKYLEEIASDVELIQEEDKVELKQYRKTKIRIIINNITGRIYVD